MRLQIASDLHHDLSDSGSALGRALNFCPEADLLVLAGNVGPDDQVFQNYGKAGKPVIFVHGNQDAHGAEIDAVKSAFAAYSIGTDVRYLERSEFVFGDVCIIGCCLWTDYQLGPYPRDVVMREANRYLVDHRLISVGDRAFTAQDAAREHAASKAWLEERLVASSGKKTVVVTHFPPSARSLPESLRAEVYAGAFGSNLEHLVPKADLWIHGHVHDHVEYEIAGTRVVCNARGYPWASDINRRPFESTLLIDI
ncbi:MAG TPA: metallophosphoesterase [Paraburkholderia sp.]|uniref:metallophosphoesterase n=1 Tax=Paraburkholderia sp. TaxID=1926495 RepID=UPI002B4A6B05|nr:metallophosphoesterase [Paraburkholderia sp.]HKR38491.1 metallophosphoesterase [Paraburkholderia sp.]